MSVGSTATFLALGFAIGIRHALDADHVAAVAALATRGGSLRRQAWQGALWGLGHTLTLLLVGGLCVLLGVAVPRAAERGFEAAVGAMLVALGLSVFFRLKHSTAAHEHRGRALLVGAVHGLAGSAALVLLVAESARTPALGLAYIALFGAGSMLGMAALASAVALPLSATAGLRRGLHVALCGGAGACSVLIGLRILWSFAQ